MHTLIAYFYKRQRIPKGQSRVDNPGPQAAFGTRHITNKQNKTFAVI